MRLFGTSGIRGVVGELLTPEFCQQIGQAFGTTLPERSRVCIATDTRLSRDMVRDAVASGLVSAGVDVVHLGITPTPALAWITREMKFDAGLMITASHNPPQYNGIKAFNPDTIGYSIAQEDELESVYKSKAFRVANVSGNVSSDEEARGKYLGHLVNRFQGRLHNENLKVVVDPGNGAASGFVSELFRKLGINCLPVNDEPDGNFPGRPSEPTGDTLKGTIDYLCHNHADLAVCFDGDADRVVFCDSQGFLGFTQMVSFASHMMSQKTEHPVVAATVEVGKLLDLVMGDQGGRVVRGKVGDVYLAHLVRENKAVIGVEDVGVYIIPEMGWYPESMFAALTLLSSIKSPGEIRDFIDGYPTIYQRKEKIPCPNDLKQATMNHIKQHAQDLDPKEVNTIDGVRLDFGDSSMLIRPSGTEPVIRIMVESLSETEVANVAEKGIQLIKAQLD